jgi:hypothetical protein
MYRIYLLLLQFFNARDHSHSKLGFGLGILTMINAVVSLMLFNTVQPTSANKVETNISHCLKMILNYVSLQYLPEMIVKYTNLTNNSLAVLACCVGFFHAQVNAKNNVLEYYQCKHFFLLTSF